MICGTVAAQSGTLLAAPQHAWKCDCNPSVFFRVIDSFIYPISQIFIFYYLRKGDDGYILVALENLVRFGID
jgi:hypothetical protein